MSTGSKTEEPLSDYVAISLEEMGTAGLMRRKDSKFIFHVDLLPGLLRAVRNEYRVLEIRGSRSQIYHTTYYDTEDLEMYHMHHRGRASRHKVRFRNYTNSGEVFLEIKRKNARRITNKKRMPVNGSSAGIKGNAVSFLEDHVPYLSRELQPALDNHFRRITLVNELQSERITLDYDLGFTSRINGKEEALPGVAIAEIKYNGHLSGSALNRALRETKVLPRRISKYCTGMALLHPDLKQNLFKSKIIYLKKLNSRAV